jgi:hypothetical protein
MSVAWSERSTSQRGISGTKPEARGSLSGLRVIHTEAREAVTDELSRNPSVLGRLVTVASMRNEQSGSYRHKLAANFGTEEMDRTLQRLHQEVFVTWLSLPLRQQQADVTIYLGGLGIKAEWFDFRKMGKSCLPPTATLPERDLFLLDLDVIQGLLRY